MLTPRRGRRLRGSEAEQVTLIVATAHNVESFIGEMVRSVIAQREAPAWRMVIVDDHSTDRTHAEINTAIPLDEDRILVETTARNTGAPSRSRNIGLDIGLKRWGNEIDYVTFIDGDDFWLPGYLRSQVDLLRSSGEETLGVWAEFTLVDTDGKRLADERQWNLECRNRLRIPYPDWVTFEDNLSAAVPADQVTRTVFRAGPFLDGLRFDERFTRMDDIELIMRLLADHPNHGLLRGQEGKWAHRRTHSQLTAGDRRLQYGEVADIYRTHVPALPSELRAIAYGNEGRLIEDLTAPYVVAYFLACEQLLSTKPGATVPPLRHFRAAEQVSGPTTPTEASL
jgi:glycosyltransferase involved in cell wall biosynthesis